MENENDAAVGTGVAQSNCLECSYIGTRKVKFCAACKNAALHRHELCEHFDELEKVAAARRCAGCQETIDKVFDENWKSMVCDEQGNLDPEKVKTELFDFQTVIDEATDVYLSITNGKFSKLTYDSSVILSEVERLQTEEISEASSEAVTAEKEEILLYIESFKTQLDPQSLGYLQIETLHVHIDQNLYKPEIKERTDA